MDTGTLFEGEANSGLYSSSGTSYTKLSLITSIIAFFRQILILKMLITV